MTYVVKSIRACGGTPIDEFLGSYRDINEAFKRSEFLNGDGYKCGPNCSFESAVEEDENNQEEVDSDKEPDHEAKDICEKCGEEPDNCNCCEHCGFKNCKCCPDCGYYDCQCCSECCSVDCQCCPDCGHPDCTCDQCDTCGCTECECCTECNDYPCKCDEEGEAK